MNTLSIVPGRIGGGETYLLNLLKQLGRVDSENIYYLFVNKQNHQMFPDFGNFRKVFCRASKRFRAARIFWEQCCLPFQSMVKKIEVLFSPANIAPVFISSFKSVLTVHDLNWLYFGQYLPPMERVLLRHLVMRSSKKADRIITVSENTKRDIISHLNVDEDKVVTIYEGLDESVVSAGTDEINGSTTEENFNCKFILSVGTTHHHKNFIRLLDAYKLLKMECKTLEHKLVLAGMSGRAHSEIMGKISELGLSEEVVIRGAVTKKELADLYRRADLFVFPSLYEGFGLPVLEAMFFGTAVAVSNRASLPEVAGDAAVYFDPEDVKDISDVMARLLKDERMRLSLKKKGYEKIKLFCWEKAARQTLEVFKQAGRC